MAVTLTVMNGPSGVDNSQRRTILQGTAALTGSYTTGGETINWLTLKSVAGNNVLLNTLSTSPLWVEFVLGIPNATPGIYFAVFNYTTKKLQIYTVAGTELAASAYAAPELNSTLFFKAEFANEA